MGFNQVHDTIAMRLHKLKRCKSGYNMDVCLFYEKTNATTLSMVHLQYWSSWCDREKEYFAEINEYKDLRPLKDSAEYTTLLDKIFVKHGIKIVKYFFAINNEP
jgi:hypothetical protein